MAETKEGGNMTNWPHINMMNIGCGNGNNNGCNNGNNIRIPKGYGGNITFSVGGFQTEYTPVEKGEPYDDNVKKKPRINDYPIGEESGGNGKIDENIDERGGEETTIKEHAFGRDEEGLYEKVNEESEKRFKLNIPEWMFEEGPTPVKHNHPKDSMKGFARYMALYDKVNGKLKKIYEIPGEISEYTENKLNIPEWMFEESLNEDNLKARGYAIMDIIDDPKNWDKYDPKILENAISVENYYKELRKIGMKIISDEGLEKKYRNWKIVEEPIYEISDLGCEMYMVEEFENGVILHPLYPYFENSKLSKENMSKGVDAKIFLNFVDKTDKELKNYLGKILF